MSEARRIDRYEFKDSGGRRGHAEIYTDAHGSILEVSLRVDHAPAWERVAWAYETMYARDYDQRMRLDVGDGIGGVPV